VVDVEIEHSNDPCDSFVCNAYYADDGTDVPESERDYLTDAYADVIVHKHFDWAQGRASDYYEGDR